MMKEFFAPNGRWVIHRQPSKVLIFVLAATVLATAGCGGKKRVASETPQPGRDNVLLQEGIRDLNRNKFIVGRLLLNTLINTYPDSPYIAVSKVALADSFYSEGTSEALAQAEVEYKDFANFFPTHPLADDALLQVMYIHMRRMLAPNRDVTEAKKAEKAALVLLQRYPNTDLKPIIQDRLRQVRNHIAEHDMEVARVQMTREQLKGARLRLKHVVDQYPEYNRMDETLYKLGKVLFELEEPDEAAKHLARLVRQYPKSDYRHEAAELLERMQKPVPAADETIEVVTTEKDPGFISSLFGAVVNLMGNPNMHVPKSGILLKKGETTDSIISTAKDQSQPAAVVTPTSTTVVVGPAGAVSPTSQTGATGKQTVTVGGAQDKGNQSDKDKKDKEKKDNKKP
jgi:outer membrane protein assembly factor BamD